MSIFSFPIIRVHVGSISVSGVMKSTSWVTVSCTAPRRHTVPKMTVEQSYLKVAERTGLHPDQVQVAFESIMKLAAERMSKGEEFVIGDMISLKKTKGKRKTVTARCMHKLFVDAGLATVIPLPDSLDPTTIG